MNGVQRRVSEFPPYLTILEYLRTIEHACGTKEGCAEGDCGACTVAVGELADGRLRYRAVNSCVAFLGQLDGKELLTVEGLADSDRGLHPVQEAVVDTHASQCGFCTPGFIMAMFAFHHTRDDYRAPAGDDVIHDVLAGNLCRCTGYRPIVEALRQASAQAWPLEPTNDAARIADLQPIQTLSPIDVARGNEHFFVPRTSDELANLLVRNPSAHILAGGTDLGLMVTKHNQKPAKIIFIGEIAELREITIQTDEIRIGAAANYEDILPVVESEYPSFGTLIRRFGSRQIRNLGTIGGNIATASPIGDSPPVLLAMGASVEIASANGDRTVGIDEFFVGYRETALRPGEFVRAIRLPRLKPNELFRTYKLSRRYDQDISAVCGAFKVALNDGVISDARIAFGGMAATPKRADAAEAVLISGAWDRAAANAAADALTDAFQPMTDFRGTAAYRLTAAANLIRRFQIDTADGDQLTDVYAL